MEMSRKKSTLTFFGLNTTYKGKFSAIMNLICILKKSNCLKILEVVVKESFNSCSNIHKMKLNAKNKQKLVTELKHIKGDKSRNYNNIRNTTTIKQP